MIIAGAGSGGHLFPGIAVAQEIKKRRKDVRVLFITDKRMIAKTIINRYGFDISFITIEGMMGKSLMRFPLLLIKLMYSLIQCAWIIKKFRPLFVLGTGGFASGPVCIVSKAFGVRTAIHEQNFYPGITNRILGRIVDTVFISFKESEKYFPSSKTIFSGNPVRSEILLSDRDKKTERKDFTVLVTGGSQGAHAINKAVLEAMKILKEKAMLPQIIHQSGERDFSWLKEEYRKNKIQVDLRAFIHDMASAYSQADIVICRAGALTVSELAILGKPSILIPLQGSAESHQLKNAWVLQSQGAGILLEEKDLNAHSLSQLLIELKKNRDKLKVMSQNARKLGREDASSTIADYILEKMGNGIFQ